MATVPGSPSSNVTPMLPPWARPTSADFLQAVAIMQEKQEQEQERERKLVAPGVYLESKTIGDIAKEWRGEAQHPKGAFDLNKAKGDPVIPKTYIESEPDPYTGKQRFGVGVT